ncbi:MAG: hypothetical protein AAFQ54_10865 [Pseudomonadota bacterium]
MRTRAATRGLIRLLLGEDIMIRTITVGTCVSIQGTFVRTLGNGQIEVRVDGQTYVGRPVTRT